MFLGWLYFQVCALSRTEQDWAGSLPSCLSAPSWAEVGWVARILVLLEKEKEIKKKANKSSSRMCSNLDSRVPQKKKKTTFQSCWSISWSSLILQRLSQWGWDSGSLSNQEKAEAQRRWPYSCPLHSDTYGLQLVFSFLINDQSFFFSAPRNLFWAIIAVSLTPAAICYSFCRPLDVILTVVEWHSKKLTIILVSGESSSASARLELYWLLLDLELPSLKF